MKVILKTVVEIDGKQIVVDESDFSESVKAALADGVVFGSDEEIIDWVLTV